ncbi:ribulose-1,5-bisphosphate carboxylase/oxygenase small subunit N-methyltransferase I [Galdieria sulphuraria]|uniref:Ribulose-1,5-bisphosphate carboxylase/oxygenase small subunit N-methyltransferase I n=1 Tax=Galdieria sulphuraria TaxID=130081 RepID=M2XZ07_GALSU|nr:ribulose-1,5-bisphosphate carboxylase/oxygenase small subunit N-methyltransferase I [Galdieria sulphuraria]EME28868.1 ribulose-1,5-bisphosphate carboxylase/oxygenase small subunit N-methyltransferase I [Galdieria sulphuraria]|eukprot:XP_005705388.1 ribulose-1,5-bisphosphate carboxylase/oxygenase small subunit N-methyltransferase I [Galdieria sulphuraria]
MSSLLFLLDRPPLVSRSAGKKPTKSFRQRLLRRSCRNKERKGCSSGGILCLFQSPRRRSSDAFSFTSGDPAVQKGWSSEISAFYDWLKENGVYLSEKASWTHAPHRLVIAEETKDEGEYSGRGLLSSRSVNLGEKVLEIPEKLMFTRKLALETFPTSIIASIEDEYVSIGLLLLYEKAKGFDSFFKPYLDILPTLDELNPLFLWSNKDLDLLQGSPTLSACEQLRDKLLREYTYLGKNIIPQIPNFASKPIDFKQFQWAFGILFSRAICFPSSKRIALVPYADLLNHSPFCSAFIDEEKIPFGNGVTEAVVYVDRLYEPYEQVYVSYGPRSNQELLLLYGFSLERNPFDCVEITIGLDKTDPLYLEKCRMLESYGKSPLQSFPLYMDRYPVEMAEFLRFCCIDTETDLQADFGTIVSASNEESALDKLLNYIVDQLRKYPTSLEDDEKIIRDRAMFQTLEKNQRMAIRQRLGEKRILHATWRNLQNSSHL